MYNAWMFLIKDKLHEYIHNVTFIKYDVGHITKFFDISYPTLQKIFADERIQEWCNSEVFELIERKKKELRVTAKSTLANVDVKELHSRE